MNAWSIKTGKNREVEEAFLEQSRILLTWPGFNKNLSPAATQEDVVTLLQEVYPDQSKQKNGSHATQLLRFAHQMKVNDAVILHGKDPKKVHVGRITSNYCFNPNATDPFYHWRTVTWLAQNVERDRFPEDVQAQFRHQATIQEITGKKVADKVFKLV